MGGGGERSDEVAVGSVPSQRAGRRERERACTEHSNPFASGRGVRARQGARKEGRCLAREVEGRHGHGSHAEQQQKNAHTRERHGGK